MNRTSGENDSVTFHFTVVESFTTAPTKKILKINILKREMEKKKNTKEGYHKQMRLPMAKILMILFH